MDAWWHDPPAESWEIYKSDHMSNGLLFPQGWTVSRFVWWMMTGTASLRSTRIHSLKVKCLGAVLLCFSHLRSAQIALDHEQVQIPNTERCFCVTEILHPKIMLIHPDVAPNPYDFISSGNTQGEARLNIHSRAQKSPCVILWEELK